MVTVTVGVVVNVAVGVSVTVGVMVTVTVTVLVTVGDIWEVGRASSKTGGCGVWVGSAVTEASRLAGSVPDVVTSACIKGAAKLMVRLPPNTSHKNTDPMIMMNENLAKSIGDSLWHQDKTWRTAKNDK
jgi:hypothetical protein